MMVKEPVFHQLAQDGNIPVDKAETEIETNRRWCLKLHSAQVLLFAMSFGLLVFVLASAGGSSDTKTRETAVESRHYQGK